MRHFPDDTYFDVQLTFSADNKTINVFSMEYGEYDNDLFDELNRFVEYDFGIIYKYKPQLDKIYDTIRNSNGLPDDLLKYDDFINICVAIADSFEEDMPGLYITLHTLLKDKNSHTDHIGNYFLQAMGEIWFELDNITIMQRDLKALFYGLSEDQRNNTDRKQIPFSPHYSSVVTEMLLTYRDGQIEYIFFCNTPTRLIIPLVIFYFSSQPLIAECQYCGRFFTPKSKKLTLYCDRVSEDGKSCKVMGARTKRKIKTDSDPILKEFYREKHRRYMACERSKLAFDYDGQTLDKYYYWLDEVTKLIEKYKKGEVSGDEVLKAIGRELD